MTIQHPATGQLGECTLGPEECANLPPKFMLEGSGAVCKIGAMRAYLPNFFPMRVYPLPFLSLFTAVGLSFGMTSPGLGQPGFSESSLTPMVTQISDSLARKISTSSCQDLASLVQQIGTTPQTPPDPNSLLGQVMIAVKNSPNLQGILISKLGTPLINRLFDCNMISVDLLNQVISPANQ